jgi:outer membrane protein
MNVNLFHATFILCVALFCNSSWGMNLKESFESALQTNQVEHINQALINQSIEQKKENQGNNYPKLSARGTYFKQDNVDVDQKTIGLFLGHTLYRGGRDAYLVDTSEKNIIISKNQMTIDRLNLYMNVIVAYYNYFLNLNDYRNLELLKKQSLERVDETRQRVRVGRNRRGELLQAEAQLASAEAQLYNGLGLIKETEELFFILTGLNKNQNEFNEIITVPIVTNSLQYYLDGAFARPDVKNQELKIELADIDLKSSKAAYYPTLDLASNYYFNEKNSTTYRNSKWDVGLTLNFPLFEGGATSARVREIVQKKEQAIYSLADYKKSVQTDITSRFETYHRYLDQVKAFDLALEKAKRSYETSMSDYRLGLVSNLDVLSSLNLYLDNKRNSEKTKIHAMMNLKLLEAAAGVLP